MLRYIYSASLDFLKTADIINTTAARSTKVTSSEHYPWTMKLLLSSLIVTACCSLTRAQSFYMKFGGGYAFPSAATPIGENSSQTYLRETDPETGYYVPAIIQTSDEVNGSFNSGITSALTIGYTFPSNIGLEVSLGYVHGRKYEATSENYDMLDDAILNYSRSTTSHYSRSSYVSPAFTLSLADEKKLRPYLQAGVVIATSKIYSATEGTSNYDGDPENVNREEEYSDGLSFGLRGGVGLELRLRSKLALFAEGGLTSMAYYPKEKTITKYQRGNEDVLATMKTMMRRTHYVKQIHIDSRSNENASDRPGEALRISFNMNNLSAQAGLKFYL